MIIKCWTYILLYFILGTFRLGLSIEEKETPIEEPPAKILFKPQLQFLNFVDNPDIFLDTPDLGAKYGYPVEVHKVTTEDGYILTIHRIRNGLHAPPAPANGRPIAWLQHGLMASSAIWILNTREKALGYRLADRGYDVWMSNSRGNVYSREHVNLTGRGKEFWDFSWHEMGQYDLPASIDYVLNVTGKKDMYFVGHSMGATVFFVCMSLRPEYNSKIRLMSAFGPIAYTEHMKGVVKWVGPYSGLYYWLLNQVGPIELMPSTALMNYFGKIVCREQIPTHHMCSNILFLLMGYNVEQLNVTMLPVLLGHIPAGSSARTPLHYGQGISNNGSFREFDFGERTNLIRYGSKTPPDYNISRITAPVALYWGTKDWLGAEQDVLKLAEHLPNVVRKYRVGFNHIDFVIAIDTPKLLYQTFERFMERY